MDNANPLKPYLKKACLYTKAGNNTVSELGFTHGVQAALLLLRDGTADQADLHLAVGELLKESGAKALKVAS